VATLTDAPSSSDNFQKDLPKVLVVLAVPVDSPKAPEALADQADFLKVQEVRVEPADSPRVQEVRDLAHRPHLPPWTSVRHQKDRQKDQRRSHRLRLPLHPLPQPQLLPQERAQQRVGTLTAAAKPRKPRKPLPPLLPLRPQRSPPLPQLLRLTATPRLLVEATRTANKCEAR